MDEDKTSSRVLVVEDEEGIQELLRVTLQRRGFEVHCEGSVESAEAVLLTWGPQLMDAQCPNTTVFNNFSRLTLG